MIQQVSVNQVETTMSVIIAVYSIISILILSRMTFVMAKQKGRNKWLWAVLTATFGAIPMAYVFWSRPKLKESDIIIEGACYEV